MCCFGPRADCGWCLQAVLQAGFGTGSRRQLLKGRIMLCLDLHSQDKIYTDKEKDLRDDDSEGNLFIYQARQSLAW